MLFSSSLRTSFQQWLLQLLEAGSAKCTPRPKSRWSENYQMPRRLSWVLSAVHSLGYVRVSNVLEYALTHCAGPAFSVYSSVPCTGCCQRGLAAWQQQHLSTGQTNIHLPFIHFYQQNRNMKSVNKLRWIWHYTSYYIKIDQTWQYYHNIKKIFYVEEYLCKFHHILI